MRPLFSRTTPNGDLSKRCFLILPNLSLPCIAGVLTTNRIASRRLKMSHTGYERVWEVLADNVPPITFTANVLGRRLQP